MGNQWDLLIVVLNTEPSTIGGTEQKWEGCVWEGPFPLLGVELISRVPQGVLLCLWRLFSFVSFSLFC